MHAALDTSALAESAALQYSDMETVRRRLIELEKNRIFSDEDLALLVRKSASTNLKADFDHRMFNRKMRRTASDRTASGRVVIRSWTPTVVGSSQADDEVAADDDGWKQFQAHEEAPEVKVARLSISEIRTNLRAVRPVNGRPSKLKHMQNRNIVITILANLLFVPKQVCCDLYFRVVSSARDSRAS